MGEQIRYFIVKDKFGMHHWITVNNIKSFMDCSGWFWAFRIHN